MPVPQHIREPAVAGRFYSPDPVTLSGEITDCYLSPLGPGALPARSPGSDHAALVGVISPHAGYIFSGPAAAWSYSAVALAGRPAAAVILGFSHRGSASHFSLSSADAWRTPFGLSPVARDLSADLLSAGVGAVVDDSAHAAEWSIETQVPFLQHVFPDLPILPIAVSHAPLSALEDLSWALAGLATAGRLVFVASSDFSHYLPRAVVERQDMAAVERLCALDIDGLHAVVHRDSSMCGLFPATVLLHLARAFGVTSGRLLHHHTSGEVLRTAAEVVGYASLAFSCDD